MLTLKTKVNQINKVGLTIAGRLRRLNISTVEDLLWHIPFRYDDFSQIAKINDLQIDQVATIQGTIELLSNRRARHRKLTITEALITDDSGSIKVIWFNQPYLAKTFKVGDKISLSGKVSGDLLGRQMNNPSYEKTKVESTHTGRLVPIYSTTDKLTNKQLRFIIHSCLPVLSNIKDWLPEEIKQQYKLIDLAEALEQVHFPVNEKVLKLAQDRLQFEQLFLIQLQQLLIKKNLKKNIAPKIDFKEKEIKEFVSQLPFALTIDQKKATWEIIKNMNMTEPMNRLLNGDVGSGKTVVATIASYNAILNDFQVALMAPTAILANQHLQTMMELLPNTKYSFALLTLKDIIIYKNGQSEKISKAKLLKLIKSGEINLTIGTHALIQEAVEFKNLGLIIVDEQHRFGVEQRRILKDKSGDKSTMPHFLSMTATPIPRTLALALYGDLDLSIIKQMPSGRQKIITKLVADKDRTKAYQFINEQITKGHQVFVICPLIDPSDKLGVKSVSEEFAKLDKEIFPHLNIGLLHGKLKPEAKNEVMDKFKHNKINILVSTSVVEVGVNIPNATVMMIEGADRFGLAQLHQFRGRVGRSIHQSYCFLFSDTNSSQTIDRLNELVNNFDGFVLAEADLKYRGAGNIYGTEQSGFNNQFLIKALKNINLLKQARDAATNLLAVDDELKHYPNLLKKLTGAASNYHLE